MKNKTIATWLAILGGPLGLHRFYLYGRADWLGWALPIPTLLGVYGIQRAQNFGLDDVYVWPLAPLLGFTFAGCALNAIIYGLMSKEKWNAQFNPGTSSDAKPGQTNWFTIAAVVTSLVFGATALMASMAFTFQRYFEYQADEAQVSMDTYTFKKSAN
jgi:hypothetical protein